VEQHPLIIKEYFLICCIELFPLLSINRTHTRLITIHVPKEDGETVSKSVHV